MRRKSIAGLIAIVVIATVLMFSGCVQNQPSEETVETPTPPQLPSPTLEEKNIGITDLIDFVEDTIHKNFPTSTGAFFRLGDGSHGYTGYNQPSTDWIYPSQSDIGSFFVIIHDFGKGNAPSISRVLNNEASFPGVGKRTLSHGDVIVQSYGPETVENRWMVEVRVPCCDQYWITINYMDNKPIDEGPIFATASDILKLCTLE